MGLTVSDIKFDGMFRTRRDFLDTIFKKCREATSFGQLTQSLSDAARRLLGFDILKGLPEFIIDEDPENRSQMLVTVKADEKKYRLHVGTEICRDDVGFGAGGTVYNVGGRGERLDISTALGSQSATPLSIDFFKPLIDGGRERFLKISLLNTLQHYFHGSNFKNQLNGLSISYGLVPEANYRIRHEFKYALDWRHVFAIGEGTSPAIRRSAGHSLKSSLSHSIIYNSLDTPVFPTKGIFFRFGSEIAGLGGSVRLLRHEALWRGCVSLPFSNLSMYGTVRIGHVTPLMDYKLKIIDKFQLGGPLSVRGFVLNGLGPRDGNDALGGNTSGEAAFGFTFPIYEAWKDTVRGHLFTNIGFLCDIDRETSLATNYKRLSCFTPNISAGLGLQVRFGEAKLEFNIVRPLIMQKEALPHRGIQVGIGVEFL